MKIKQIGKRVLATALCFLLTIGGMSLPTYAADDDYYLVSFDEVVGKFETDYGTTQHDTRISYFEDFISSEALAEYFFDYASGLEYFTISFPQSDNSNGGTCRVYLSDEPFVFNADEYGNAVLDMTARPFSTVRVTTFTYSNYYKELRYSTPATYSGTSLTNVSFPALETTDFSVITTRNANYLWATNYPLCDSSGALVLGGIGDTEISFPEFPEMQEFKDISEFLGSITENAPSMENYNIFIPDDEFNTNDIVAAALRIILLIQQLPKLISFFIDTVAYYLSHITDILVALFDFMSTNVIIAVTNINLILKYIGDLIAAGIDVVKQLLNKEIDFDFDLSGILEPVSALKTLLEEKISPYIAEFKIFFSDILAKINTFYDDFSTFVSSTIKTIGDNIASIPGVINDFKDFFSELFDVSKVDIFGRIQELKEYLFLKVPILDSLSDFYSDISYFMTDSLANRTPPSITFPTSSVFGGEDIVVSLGFLAPVIAVTDVIIVAACYILTLVYSIRAIPNILGSVGSGTSALVNSFSSSSGKGG